jgi:copper(I)-binding protein
VRAQPAIARRVGVVVAVGAVLLTAACAAGQHAQTAYENPTVDAAAASIGNIQLRGIAIDAPTGTTSYQAGSDASLTLVMVNDGRRADQLTSITSPAFTSWSAAPSQGPVSLSSAAVNVPPGTRVGFGTPEATDVLTLVNLKQSIFPGTNVALTFSFQNAGTVTVSVPVAVSTAPSSSFVPGPTAASGIAG